MKNAGLKRYRVELYQKVIESTFYDVYASTEAEAEKLALECMGNDENLCWEYSHTEDSPAYAGDISVEDDANEREALDEFESALDQLNSSH